jgi:hypothetical protein
LARTQPFLSHSVEKRGDQSNSNAEKWSIILQFAVTYAAVCCGHGMCECSGAK